MEKRLKTMEVYYTAPKMNTTALNEFAYRESKFYIDLTKMLLDKPDGNFEDSDANRLMIVKSSYPNEFKQQVWVDNEIVGELTVYDDNTYQHLSISFKPLNKFRIN